MLPGLLRLASTPSPSPNFNPQLVTPGVWGFVITFLIAVVTVLLILDMTRRIRRARYRAEVAAKLDAEAKAAPDDPESGKKPENHDAEPGS